MTSTQKLFFLSAAISTYFLYGEIVIRRATLADLDTINNFTEYMFRDHFAQLYSYIIAPADFDDFMSRHIQKQRNACLEFITKQCDHEAYGIIVAENITLHKQPQLVGYCRFNQKKPQNVHIYFVGVDKTLTRQGIGEKLVRTAITTFDNVTHCTLRTHAYRNDIAHAFYKKLGFELVGFASLDPQTGLISDNSELPVTHANYYLAIKK